MSDDARFDILRGIRHAIGRNGAGDGARAAREADYAAVARTYRQTGARTLAERIELFTGRVHDYDGGVHRCASEAELASCIGDVLTARGKRRLLVPPGLPRAWCPDGLDGIEFGADEGQSAAELEQWDGVITACTVAIALTGTIVLRHTPREGRRALSLIPDYHLCVVRIDQIVETVPEAFQRLVRDGDEAPAIVTTISGPSATADIEMTRIRGVHGPRVLDVILLEP